MLSFQRFIENASLFLIPTHRCSMHSPIPSFRIEKPTGPLYIVTDSHLDFEQAPFEEFIEMLEQLQDAQVLICLGDLFKVWLAMPKFWMEPHRRVMEAFRVHRERGAKVVFVAGNREKLVPRDWEDSIRDPYPFTHLSREDWHMQWGGLQLGFIHGDAINTKDLRHLRWRALSNSHAFENLFRIMPGSLARWIAFKVEAMLAGSNRKFKINFPDEEVNRFAEQVLPGVDHYFVGHFHQDRVIRIPGESGILRIVPDWLLTRKVLKLNPEGQFSSLIFQEGVFQETVEEFVGQD